MGTVGTKLEIKQQKHARDENKKKYFSLENKKKSQSKENEKKSQLKENGKQSQLKENEKKSHLKGNEKSHLKENKKTLISNENRLYIKTNKHLICDDAYTNRLVLKKYLLMFGCDIDEAENGIDAIEKIKENGEYNIIWMDIKMPKMDGHECTRILRQEMGYKGKIIGLTGYVDAESIRKSMMDGMDNVVSKPFDSRIIESFVNEYKSL